MESEMIEHGITKVSLDGRLDIGGTNDIDMEFTALTSTQKAEILIDMTNVSFMASIGMRTFLSSAKALSKHGGKMVLANCQPLVKEALQTAGIDTLIPVHDSLEDAISDLTG